MGEIRPLPCEIKIHRSADIVGVQAGATAFVFGDVLQDLDNVAGITGA
jgi:hypothetical protein